MPRPVPVLEGEAVRLRPLDPEGDADDYYEWNLEPDMHLWTGNTPLASPDSARKELERLSNLSDFTTWAVEDRASSKMIGRFFVCIEEREDMVIAGEGNRIAKAFWRKGHNREARRLIFKYLFDDLEVDAIETECWSENVNSRQSIIAHGFQLLAETWEQNPKHGRAMLKCRFRLERQDWDMSKK